MALAIDGSRRRSRKPGRRGQMSHSRYRHLQDCPCRGWSDRVTAVLPIERPQKIICIGLNYRDHAEEQGVALPERPLLFAKWPNTLIGPASRFACPRSRTRSTTRPSSASSSARASAGRRRTRPWRPSRGYLCANDVSGRDVQFADKQWVRGKSFDTFCPVGPELVPASDVPDPQALGIRAILNGQVMQDSTTANMVFGVAEIVEFVSQAITLEPGDLILTGHARRRRCLPRPEGAAEARRRDHDRDRRPGLADKSRRRPAMKRATGRPSSAPSPVSSPASAA